MNCPGSTGGGSTAGDHVDSSDGWLFGEFGGGGIFVAWEPGVLTQPGTYTGSVSVFKAAYANSPLTIPVTVVVGTPLLTASPSALSISYRVGDPIPQQRVVSIASTLDSIQCSVQGPESSWLALSSAGSQLGSTVLPTPFSLVVQVNPVGLSPGTYSANIPINPSYAPGGQPSSVVAPTTINVTLTITNPVLTVPSVPLMFNSTIGGSPPPAQFVSITGTSGISFTTTTATTSGGLWLSATPSGAVPSSVSVLVNTTGLSAGVYNGTLTVNSSGATGSPASIPVTLNVTAAILTATPSQLTFSYQFESATQPPAQLINVSDPSNINFTISTATTSGGPWLLVTPGTGNASGSVSVSVNATGLSASVYNGAVTIAAPGVTQQVITVSLVATGPTITSIVSGASYDTSGFSPGTIVTIFGNLLGPQIGEGFNVNSHGSLDTTLGGTTVMVEGVPAIPLFVQSGQINMILPYTLSTSGQAAVQVHYDNLTSAQFDIPMMPADVQIFTANASGSGSGSILNQDFSVNTASNPAAPNSVVQVYGTGGGVLNPSVTAGLIAGDTLSWVTLPYSAAVNGEDATVLYAGSAPELVYGVYQFNVQLPADVPSGAQKIVLKVGNSTSQSDVTVYVK